MISKGRYKNHAKAAPHNAISPSMIRPWTRLAKIKEKGLNRGLKIPSRPHFLHTLIPFSSKKQLDVLKKPKKKSKTSKAKNNTSFTRSGFKNSLIVSLSMIIKLYYIFK